MLVVGHVEIAGIGVQENVEPCSSYQECQFEVAQPFEDVEFGFGCKQSVLRKGAARRY